LALVSHVVSNDYLFLMIEKRISKFASGTEGLVRLTLTLL